MAYIPIAEARGFTPLMVNEMLKEKGSIKNADLRQLLDVSSATANRLLRKWTEDGKLRKYRDGQTWAYQTCPRT